MSKADYVLSAFSNFLRILVIWRFIRIFFVPVVEKRKELLGYMCYFIVTLAVFLQFQYPLFNMLASWGGLVLLTAMYQGNWKKKCLIGTLIYAINGICDAVAAYLFYDFMKEENVSQIIGIFTALFFYICQMAAEKIVGNRGKEEVQSMNVTMFLVPAVSVVMVIILAMEPFGHQGLLVFEGCGILLVNMLLFVIYNQMANAHREQMQKEQMEKQVLMYQNQLELMEDSKRKVQTLRHDMRHHLQSLYAMTKEGQQEKVLQFIEDMEVSLENPKQHITTGNGDLDTILNYSWDKAEQLGIQMECKTGIAPNFSVSVYELSVILGNLLENAIDAAKQTKKPYISLKITGDKGVLAVQVKNSYNGIVEKRGTQLVSTKEGKEHGVGLNNVRNLAEQKQGSVQIDYDEKEFRVEVVIYV